MGSAPRAASELRAIPGAAAFGTYVVSSPDIGETCWEQNPCVASDGYILTSACKLEDGSGERCCWRWPCCAGQAGWLAGSNSSISLQSF